jgi:hypothetical protein
VGLHQQARAILLKPSAPVTISKFHKIHGPVIFVGPIVIFNAADTDIHENHAAWTQERHHAAVRRANISVTMAGISVAKHTL